MSQSLNILGIRGIPAAHGGFETFAERLACHMRDRGWEVTVYCQGDPDPSGGRPERREDAWNGIQRVHFGTRRGGPVGTIEFDYQCVRDVLDRPGVDLVLGYNTAVLNIRERLRGRPVVMNMDGIEWKRAKWSLPAKIWFFVNEVAGVNLCSLPIADHPEISRHLSRRSFKRNVMIPYGADRIEDAPAEPVTAMGLTPNGYLTSIARIEPENSILEVVQAFSRKPRGIKLVVLGRLEDGNDYHGKVKAAAGDEVVFPGAIYDQSIVQALRFHCRAYMHGHQVGGTNPSLVEALGCGNAVIAHDNKFNRWTAGPGQFYFRGADACAARFDEILDSEERLADARRAARERHQAEFTWDAVLAAYEEVLSRYAR
jgi:glycosyltransferase involved in cell wall biosynthesis